MYETVDEALAFINKQATRSEAAAGIGASEQTVMTLVARGKLKAYRIGEGHASTIRIDRASIDAYRVEKRRKRAG
jgi:excisionase family DNA binding protein